MRRVAVQMRVQIFSLVLALVLGCVPGVAAGQQTPPPPTATPAARPTATRPQLTVTGTRVNIRSGPGLGYAVAGRVVQGDTLAITGRNAGGDWWQVDYTGQPGWIYAQLARTAAEAAAIPVVAATPAATAPPGPTPAATAAAAATPALPPLRDSVVLGPATTYPVRSQRYSGWGYEIVDAAADYDLLMHRDVYGYLAHQLWEDTLYQRHPKGIRVTIVDNAGPGRTAGWLQIGDGEGAQVAVTCIPDDPERGATQIADPEECVIAIEAPGPHLTDIVLSSLVLGYHRLSSSSTPAFSNAPYSPTLGQARREASTGQWRWGDPFLEVVALRPPAVATVAAPVARGPLPPPTGHIAFTRGRDYAGPTPAGVSDIALVDVESGEVRVVAANGRQPDVRSDGRIVFNGEGAGRDDLQVVEPDGSGLRPIGKHPEDSAPRWSDDGSRLAFHSLLAGVSDRIFIQQNAEVQEEPMHLQDRNDPLYGRYPFWTSDGLGYTGCIRGSCGIRVTGLAWAPKISQTFRRQLTTFPEDRATDVYADTVLFASPKSGNWDLYTVPAAGGKERSLTDSPSQDLGGSYSPDGNYIAFMSDRGGGWGIWIMEADGANPRQLVAVPEGFGKLWDQDRLAWGP